jgi:hypothetical protein
MVDSIKSNLPVLEQNFIQQICQFVDSAIEKFNTSYEETEFNIDFDLDLESERCKNLIRLVYNANCKKSLTLNLNTLIKDIKLNKMAI